MAITDKLTAIADAIRLKTGDDTPMTMDDMALRIGLIEGGIDFLEEIPLTFTPGYIKDNGTMSAQSATLEMTTNKIRTNGKTILILLKTNAKSGESWFAYGYWKDGQWVARRSSTAALCNIFNPTQKSIYALSSTSDINYPRDEFVLSFRTYGDYEAKAFAISEDF